MSFPFGKSTHSRFRFWIPPLLSFLVPLARRVGLRETPLVVLAHRIAGKHVRCLCRGSSAAASYRPLSPWCRHPTFIVRIIHRRFHDLLWNGELRHSWKRFIVFATEIGVIWCLSYLIVNAWLRSLSGWWSANPLGTDPTASLRIPLLGTLCPLCRRLALISLTTLNSIPLAFDVLRVAFGDWHTLLSCIRHRYRLSTFPSE